MNEIESKLQLPKGARPLEEYARYYTDDDRGHVIGVYVIPMNDDLRPGDKCEELTANLSSHEVPCEPFKPDWAMPDGQRRWVPDQSHLPVIDDGGCGIVTVEFDRTRSTVTQAVCNGDA